MITGDHGALGISCIAGRLALDRNREDRITRIDQQQPLPSLNAVEAMIVLQQRPSVPFLGLRALRLRVGGCADK